MRAHKLAMLFLAILTPSALEAQIVRGRVTEQASAAPIVGVLVSLVPDGNGVPATSVLSNVRGEYAIRASITGRYRLDVKRIGAQRFISEWFNLAAGETKQLDVTLEALVYRLPEVRVVEADLCVPNASQSARVAA